MNKLQKIYYQLIPEKVLEILPKLETSMKGIPGFSSDRLKEIISIIATHIRKDDAGWAALKMEYLRKQIPQADKYIEELRRLVIIERSGYACIGKTSYKYRFTLAYRTKYIRLPSKNLNLIRRNAKLGTTMKKRNSKKYPDQNQFLRGMTIEKESLEFIKSFTDEEKYNYSVSSITRIRASDIFFIIDDTARRYHSNLTNLPKELRQFIRINGKSLVNLDTKNCQPYLSILILNNPGKVAKFAHSQHLRMVLESLEVKQTEDVSRYISLVKNGQIYEYLLENFKQYGLNIQTRDDVKKLVLQILFDRNNHSSCARKIFDFLFPEVSRVFSLVRGVEKGTHFESFKRFSILLQRIESYIILDKIILRINREYPGQIAVTIHDSIMTENEPSQIERIRKIMIEEFTKVIGVEPKIKVEVEVEVEGKKEEERKSKGEEGNNRHYCARSLVWN
jgi:hypothetical protein